MSYRLTENDLPPDWTFPKLGSLGRFISGVGFPEHEQGGAIGVPFFKVSDMNLPSNEIEMNISNNYMTEAQIKRLKLRVVEDPAILFAKVGAAIFLERKRIARRFLIDNNMMAFVPSVDLRFTKYLLENLRLSRYAQTGALPAYNASDLRTIRVPLPGEPEQKAIANVLGLADKAIELNNKIIAQKELRKKWLMQNLLTSNNRLRGFTEEWTEVGIDELLGKVFRYVKWNDEAAYKLVSIRRRYRGLFERGELFGHQIEVKKIKSIQKNDFLISKRQVSHGAWSIVSSEFQGRMVSDEYDCLALKDPKKLNMEFWGWFCQNPKMTHYAYLASNGVHIEKLIFDFNSFRKRKVRIPELEEQTAIVQVLKAADKEIRVLKAKTEKLREQKKGMMQQLLTGKKRLRIAG